MKIVSTKKAPEPKGHYSQAIIHNGTVYLSGVLPIDKDSGDFVGGDIAAQCKVVFSNFKAILEASGSGLDKVLNVTIYVADIQLWPAIDKLYSDFFSDCRPCRTIVPTSELHYGAKIEMNAVGFI